jgi:hypothetical protein
MQIVYGDVFKLNRINLMKQSNVKAIVPLEEQLFVVLFELKNKGIACTINYESTVQIY